MNLLDEKKYALEKNQRRNLILTQTPQKLGNGFFKSSFIENHIKIGNVAVFNNDWHRAKQEYFLAYLNFRISSRNKLSQLYNNEPWEDLISIIFCDHPDSLRWFKEYDYLPEAKRRPVVGLQTFFQKLLRGDGEAARLELDKYHSQYLNADIWRWDQKSRSTIMYDPDVMRSVQHKDKDGVIKWLDYITSEEIHRLRYNGLGHGFLKDHLSASGLFVLRMCWLLGMEIEYDSKYIPMEMVPMQPLDHYEVPYFWLEGYEGEVPKAFKDCQTVYGTDISQWPRPKKKEKAALEWDKTKYKTAWEAAMVENALKNPKVKVVKTDKGWDFIKKDSE